MYWTQDQDYDGFLALSLEYPDVPFKLCKLDQVRQELDFAEHPKAFVVFRDFDEGKKFLVFSESPNMRSMK